MLYICSDRARTVSSGSYQHNTRIRMQSSIGFISSFSLCLFYLPYEISFVQSSKMQSIPVTRIAYDLYIGLDSTRIFFVFCSSRNTRRLATPTSTFFHSWLWATKNGLGKEVETKSFRIKQNDCLLPIYSMCMHAPGLDAVASTAHGNLILPFAALSAPSSNVPHIALTTLAVCFSCVA